MTTTSFINLIRFNATAAGSGSFVVASAASGCVTPEQAFAIDGKAYYYVAKSADGTQFEYGKGAYVYATHTLARTTITSTSNKDQVAVNFTTAPIVDVFPAARATLEPGTYFPAGTTTVFYQAAAPLGWTKLVTQNDKALRVVSGSGGVAGGTNTFSSVMAQTVVGSSALSQAQSAAHAHNVGNQGLAALGLLCSATNVAVAGGGGSSSVGSGTTHNHSILMDIQYIDLILASKN